MTGASPAGGAWRRPLLFTVLGAAVGVGASLLVGALAGDDAPSGGAARASTTVPASEGSTVPTPTTVAPADLGPEAKELVALAAKGRGKVFHARYATSGGVSPAGAPFTVRMELWNKGSEVRRNVSIDTAGQVLESADMRRRGLFIRCAKSSAAADWQCLTPPSAPNDPGGVAFGLAPAALAGKPVSVSDETVADQKARCFKAEVGTGSVEELCLSKDGIPLRVTSGAAVLELQALELSVDEGAFEPPARPIGA